MSTLTDNPIVREMVNEYWLRAAEWTNWPTFVSQPLVPILFIFYSWYVVIAGLLVLGVLWAGIRYKYINLTAARAAVPFVVFAKWPAAIGSAIYLYTQHRYFAGVLAFVWPLVGVIVMVPGKIGLVQRLMMRKAGTENLLSFKPSSAGE
jgi:hypothetical protein